MKFPMPREYKYIRSVDDIWYGKQSYKEGLSVPEITIKYGSIYSKIKTMPFYGKYIIGSLKGLNRAVKSNKNNPYTGIKTVTPELLNKIEAYGMTLGVSQIGYITVNESHLFKESIVLFKHAILLTMEMKKSEIQAAPSIRTIREIFRTYYELGNVVNDISDFLRSKGYNAQPVPAISNNVNLALMARDAGLGEFGKHGLLITKEFGPSVRIAAVLTDIENLPFNNSDKQTWIKNFCDSCNACVKKCPAEAIYEKPLVFEDGSEQHIDYKKCAIPFSKDNGCTVCIKECAFFKTNYEKIQNGHMNNK